MKQESAESLSFSAWLRQQRRILDITRDELGRRAHCSPETIKKIESGERLPSKELAGLIADSLGVPAEQRERFVHYARNISDDFLRPATGAAEAARQPGPASGHEPTLLKTKLFMPMARPNMVRRPRLIAQLKTGLLGPLTLIASSAGFGKTTLASQIATFEEFDNTAWLSLDADDNDPARFITYFIYACQRLDPGVGAIGLTQLHGQQPPSIRRIMSGLINELARTDQLARTQVLILDDYHVINAPEIHEALAYAIDNLPQHLRVVLVSRSDPPLPLARWRARNMLTELRAGALRFTIAETSEFFSHTAAILLAPGQINALEARTEGWIAGLQLAALSMRGAQDLDAFISAFSGSNRFVLDYLMDEVLNRQPDSVQQFLLRTSLLSHLNASLCDALLEQPDSQSMLEQLERGNLFVIALDQDRQWYRYHHLFADVLRSRLLHAQPALATTLHRRASAWHEQHGLPFEAVQHAMAARDFPHAAQLIEQYALTWLLQGNGTRARDLIGALPSDLQEQRPRLRLARIWMLAGVGRLESASSALDELERTLRADPAGQDDATEGEIATLRALSHGAYRDPMTIGFARRALALLPTASPVRPLAFMGMALAHYNIGELAEAEAIYTQALARVAHDPALLAEQVGLRTSLGLVLLTRGHLNRAAAICAESLALAGAEGEVLPNGASLALTALGLIALQRNRLDEAGAHLTRSVALARHYQGLDAEIYAVSNLALLHHARGDWQAALAQIAHALAITSTYAQMVRNALESVRAGVWLEQGHATEAAQWATGLDPRFEQSRPRMTPLDGDRFVRARIWMAHSQWNQARVALAQLQADAAATGHGVFLLQAQVMLALVCAAQGNEAQAHGLLAQALAAAEPEGFVRVFLDEGAPLRRLLSAYHAQARLPVHAYAQVIRAAFASSRV